MNRIERDLNVLVHACVIKRDVDRIKTPSAEDLKIFLEAEAIRRDPKRSKQIKKLIKEKLERERNRKEKAKKRAIKQLEEIRRKRAEAPPAETEVKTEPAKPDPETESRPEAEREPEPKTVSGADLPEVVAEVENPPKLERAASPQIEDGHTDIAHEIAEQLARHNLSAYESRIVWAIFRKTYGWHKKEDLISFTQFEKATGIKRWHVARTLAELVERKIVTRIGNSRIITYGFQKDYTKWRNITKRGNDVAISSLSGEGRRKIVTRIGNRSLPKGVNTKETNKRNLFADDSIQCQLATLLLKEIQNNKPNFKQPNLQAWAKHIDLMIRRDGRKSDRIREVILWCQCDHFWWKNILSTRNLREKFDRLEAEIISSQKGKEPERPKEKPRILTAED